MVASKILSLFALHFQKRGIKIMSRICDLTGKKAIVGNSVSFSNRKTRRLFKPNLQVKKFFIPEENEWITLKVSTSALRTINKKGISACIDQVYKNGYLK